MYPAEREAADDWCVYAAQIIEAGAGEPPSGTDALARLAIWVESGPGTPTRRRTANTVRPSVSHPTTTNVSQSVKLLDLINAAAFGG